MDKRTRKKARARVSRKRNDESEEIEYETVRGLEVTGHPANLGVSASQTLNVGKYESVRVEVSLHMPSGADEDELDSTYEFVQEWVGERLGKLVAEVEHSFKNA